MVLQRAERAQAAHFFFEGPEFPVGFELEELEPEGLLWMGVIVRGERPPFGAVVFPELAPFEDEEVEMLRLGLFEDI